MPIQLANNEKNMELSRKRAEAVEKYFISKIYPINAL